MVSADDGFPAQICQRCLCQVNQWYEFKCQCERADAKLREHFDKDKPVMETSQKSNESCSTVGADFLQDVPVKEEDVLDYGEEHILIHPVCELKVESSSESENEDDEKSEDDSAPASPFEDSPAKATRFYRRKWVAPRRRNSKTSGPPRFECKECDKEFPTKYKLTIHMAVHGATDIEFICGVCNKRCISRSSYNSHKVIHRQRTYVCDICGRAYKSTWDLKAHLRSHTGERPYLCSVCGKSYTTRGSLSVHIKGHSGEKVHMCPTCGKSFANRSSLVRHLKIHTGEKPYVCTLCDKAFAHKKSLTKHGRVHTREKPFPCTVCSRAFADKWHLTQHLRLHTGEKPYVCPLCGQAFTHNVSLREHVRQHNGELWRCEACGKTYSSRSSLTAHNKQVHCEGSHKPKMNDEDANNFRNLFSGQYNLETNGEDVSNTLRPLLAGGK